jgi:hypothetical protein
MTITYYKYGQPFPFQGPPKFTQIGIFGLKIYHLATLHRAGKVAKMYSLTARKKKTFKVIRKSSLHLHKNESKDFSVFSSSDRRPSFIWGAGPGSATPCASPPPPRPSIFPDYSFWVHLPVNWDDWHLLAHAMASDFSVAWKFLSKTTIGFWSQIKLHACRGYFFAMSPDLSVTRQ